MSAAPEVLFGNNPSIERKEAIEGFSVSYQINHSELIFGRELGRGGFGIVYQGTWRKHTDVAIKQLLSDDISSEAKEEFDTESQVMARLHSPHIVQFYGYCLSPRRCIVMEHMPNGSLYSVLRNTKQPLDWTIRIRIAIDMASGLAFLHQEHIIHRDIKSLNVLLNKSYGAKLTDFGLSKVKTETKSQSMATKTSKDAVGTVQWMAPELFKRKAVYTSKSDIYSLGITFWELAARKIPYSADPQEAIPAFVQQGEREDIPKDCPQKLASLIAACWAGSPDKRPDADAVVTYLKSEQTNFAQFLPLLTAHRASTANSTLSGLSNLQTTLLAFVQKTTFPEQKNPPAPAIVPALNQVAKPSPKAVNAIDLTKFLKLIAEGEQDNAEAMLKSNPVLALISGDVTDLSKRTFTNITAFQYAVWALDWHMWTMIRKYLPIEATRGQAEEFETGSWVSQHGVYTNALNILLKAYHTSNNFYGQFQNGEGDKALPQVSAAQLLLPAHVINEYCHPTRSFEPTPNFKKDPAVLPRSRSIGINNSTHPPRQIDWFAYPDSPATKLRGGGQQIEQSRGACITGSSYYSLNGRVVAYLRMDLAAVGALTSARTAQREELIAELKRKAAPRKAA